MIVWGGYCIGVLRTILMKIKQNCVISKILCFRVVIQNCAGSNDDWY